MPQYADAERRYAETHKLADLFDDLCAEVLTERPADPRAHLARYVRSQKCTESLSAYPAAAAPAAVPAAAKPVGASEKGPPPPPPPAGGGKGGPPPAPGGKGKGGKGGPPPPPPPPPKDFHAKLFGGAAPAAKKGGAAPDMSAVFAELSKGCDITKGLKKVDRSQMTHKNRDKQEVGKATDFEELERKKAARQEELARKQAAGGAKKVKDPVFELDGKRWKIENQIGTRQESKSSPLGDDGTLQMSHAVVLHGCENYDLFINIESKINSVSLTDCKNTRVQFGDVVASVEVNKCSKVALFAQGELKSIFLDKSTEVAITTCAKSRGVDITACACTACNITFPPEGGKEDDDPIEQPLPEQFKTRIAIAESGKPSLITEPAVHAD